MFHSSKISVIIPVYNAEKWLRRCIDSILAQTFTDFELLLVDDGSTDGSPAICDSYATLDPRVRVFHKPNGGVSSARNLGLDNARGVWVTFVDSDDFLSPHSFQSLINHINKETDIIIGDFDFFNNESNEYHHPSLINREQFISEYISSSWIVIWGCLIRNEILKRNKIRFPEHLRYSEDFRTMVSILNHSKGIVRDNSIVYHYFRGNENSATSQNNDIVDKHQHQAYLECIEEIINSLIFPSFEKGICWHLLRSEQSQIKNLQRLVEFRKSYPRKFKYLYSNPFISKKMKFLMLLVWMKMTFLTKIIIKSTRN